MADVAIGWRAVAVAAAIAAVAGAGIPLAVDAPGAGDGPPNALRSCTDIDEPGRYVLGADIEDSRTDTCLRIRTSDVVLDGAGHLVDGVGTFGTAGVVVRPAGDGSLSNVTVRNVTVTDWDDGVRFVDVAGGRLDGATSANNRVGVSLLSSRRITIADTVARDNRLRGISLVEASANNTLAGNVARGNDLFGFHLVDAGTRNNTLVGNVASENAYGVVLIGAHDNVVVDTAATDNRIAGVWLAAARDNRVGNGVVASGFYGVFLSDRSTGNVVEHVLAESNAVGVRLRSSDANAVANNVIRRSRDTGLLLIASDGNRIAGNVGTGNARGVVQIRSAGNVVENNSVR